MAITPKQAPNQLMELLPLLLGEKTTSSQQATANTGPLQQVFAGAQQPMTPDLYQALIGSIFNTAAQQIPELTAAFANATGSRSSSNSGLALGLEQLRQRSGQEAAGKILDYNQNQQRIAADAAGGIATATRGATSTQRQGTATNPLIPLVGGFALNQLDKRGFLDNPGAALSGISDGISSFFAPSTSGFDYAGLDSQMGFGSAVDSAPVFSNFNDSAGSFFGGASDLLGGVGGFFEDIGSGIGDFFSGFGFADGGTVKPQAGGMIPARANAPMAVADGATMGADPNQLMQAILMQAMMPQPSAPPPINPINFLRYLLPTSGFNIYNYADGGVVGRGRGYADGGMIRNRNYMGAAPVRGGMNVIEGMGPGGSSVGSEVLRQIIGNTVSMVDTGRMSGGNGTVEGRETAGGAVNMAAGNPLGNQVATAMLGALAGMTAPQAVASLTSSPAAGALTNPAISSLAGVPTGLMGFVQSMVEAARRESLATTDIATSADPLGAFLGAINAANPAAGINTSGLTTGVAADAANAASAINSNDPISNLIAVTNNFAQSGGNGSPSTGYGGYGPDSSADGAYGGYGGYGSDDSASSAYGGSMTGGSSGSLSGGRGGDSSDGGGVGDSSTGPGGADFANGGLIRGPGTGTSDSIRAKSRDAGGPTISYSNGEIVIPRDTVQKFGEQYFLDLIQKTHMPARK